MKLQSYILQLRTETEKLKHERQGGKLNTEDQKTKKLKKSWGEEGVQEEVGCTFDTITSNLEPGGRERDIGVFGVWCWGYVCRVGLCVG